VSLARRRFQFLAVEDSNVPVPVTDEPQVL
jgi:hypothetical protein